MEIVKIGKKAPPAKKKDDSSCGSDETDSVDTTPPELHVVAKPTNHAKDSDSSDASSDDESEETKEPAKARIKRKKEESESDSDDGSGDESETHNVPQAKKMKKEHSAIVGNLSLGCDENSLYSFNDDSGFESSAFGTITRHGQSKGFGHAEFSNKLVPLNVIKTLSKTGLWGRNLILDLASCFNSSSTTPRGGFGGIGGHGMSEAIKPELLSNLRAINEKIRSLDERIEVVNHKINGCQDQRKNWKSLYTETNMPDTASLALRIVWELDNQIGALLKSHESLMMKLELEKSALQSLQKGFVFRVSSDNNKKKMTFCLIDIYNPVYREVYLDASISDFPFRIPLDALPDILKPCSQIEHKKDRNVGGKYVGFNGKYIYAFDTPLCASSATLDHFIDVVNCHDDLTVALTTVDIPTPFIPVKQVFPGSVIETAAEVIDQALENIDTINCIESIHATVKQAFDDVWSKPLKSVTINNNQQLVNWLKPLLCNDSFILSEKRIVSQHFTYYQNSKTGRCILMKNSPNGVVIQSVQEMDEDEEQQVESSEDRTLSQLLAGMMATAGEVAGRCIQYGTYFKEVTVYGVFCSFESNEASLCKLILNFELGESKIIKYVDENDQPQFSSIDRMILYAVNLSFNH
ncbi:PREDICTED: uncharacterized protein LOC109587027 [Amphimedon queenslandica]|uniref:Uncharacterized protein n=1 Tax=Amphimedon queenslandica TaxID=400682 RepID=A0AAN0JPR3_AMPQE|nr:PREDICTED: uncharacterized protein LOC109587027 [Amphimedon queenslandica]|eukprot:XP_019858806.1 PREDICTED: uncharacterized protein LOC109587027 [Amphimedon queenslandica]